MATIKRGYDNSKKTTDIPPKDNAAIYFRGLLR